MSLRALPREKILTEYDSVRLFKSSVTKDSWNIYLCRSLCRRSSCKCFWTAVRGHPTDQWRIRYACMMRASIAKCHGGKIRAVRNINSIPLIHFIMLENISAWQTLSIRYLLMCSICFRENTYVSMKIGSNCCPLTRVKYIFQMCVGVD